MKVFHCQIWVSCCDIIFQIINSNQNIVFICEKNKVLMKSVYFFVNRAYCPQTLFWIRYTDPCVANI